MAFVEQAGEDIGSRCGILRPFQNKSVSPLRDQILCPYVGADDDGQRGRHGLQNGQTEGVKFRKHAEEIGGPVHPHQFFTLQCACENDPVSDSQAVSNFLILPDIPAADDHQTPGAPGFPGSQYGQTCEQMVEALDFKIHGHEEDEGFRRSDSMTEARFPVQYVIKAAHSESCRQGSTDGPAPNGDRFAHRFYAGTLVSGQLKQGDPVVVLPSGVTTKVGGIWFGEARLQKATPGMAVSLTLEGEHDIVRGEFIAPEEKPPATARLLKVQLVWMVEHPLYAGRRYLFKSLGGTAVAEVLRIRNTIDLASYRRLAADRLSLNDIGEAELALSRPVPFDPYRKNRETGGFILIDRLSNATAACGMILHALRRSNNVNWEVGEIERGERAAIKGQKPCVLWFTGLSGAGKSTIANCLERKLHRLGRHTMLLDGDNIRQGLNRDLGFTEAGRIENIRRVGEVAKLMTDAGLIVITAFISPFRSEREMVRRLLPHGEFIEIFVSTPLEECERRDPKKLYRKARKGEIPNFTGIGSPYEAPETPEIRVNAAVSPVDESADAILRYLSDHGLL